MLLRYLEQRVLDMQPRVTQECHVVIIPRPIVDNKATARNALCHVDIPSISAVVDNIQPPKREGGHRMSVFIPILMG